MKSKLLFLIVACSSLVFAGFVIPNGGNSILPEQSIQDGDQDDQLEAEARVQFMRGKLAANQLIVEGLSLKDFSLVREGADNVTALVKGQHWFVLKTKEYQEHSREMETAVGRLADAADAKNIEAAALRYFEVTLSCIDCHTYLESTRQ